DDLLDCYGDEAKLGKKVGSDLENNKSTYVSLLGKDGAEDKLTYHRDAAVDELTQIDEQFNTKHLLEIVDLFYSRDH
ncbi:polyprenyl synthetase family protein, partial [Staphylococcus aureus]